MLHDAVYVITDCEDPNFIGKQLTIVEGRPYIDRIPLHEIGLKSFQFDLDQNWLAQEVDRLQRDIDRIKALQGSTYSVLKNSI